MQKQKTNVYTVMLILAFLALVVACTLLYWELTLYGKFPWWKPGARGGPGLNARSAVVRVIVPPQQLPLGCQSEVG